MGDKVRFAGRAGASKDIDVKQIVVRFEEDRSVPDIRVLFRASRADAQVTELMNRVRSPFVGKLTVTDSSEASVFVPLEHVVSIATDNKRLKVLADDGTYLLKGSLKEMERMLSPNMFLRISRYEIINLRKVQRFDFTLSGVLRIELEQGVETWASRRFVPVIRQRLQEQRF